MDYVKSPQERKIMLILYVNHNSDYTKQRVYAESRLEGLSPWRFVNSYKHFRGL